jgi:hypothetical protein
MCTCVHDLYTKFNMPSSSVYVVVRQKVKKRKKNILTVTKLFGLFEKDALTKVAYVRRHYHATF